jgi:hypothetical protein
VPDHQNIEWRQLVLESQLLDGNRMIGDLIKALLRADLVSSEFLTRCAAHSRWHARIVPPLESSYGSSNIDGPSLLSNSDFCECLRALSVLTRIRSFFFAEFGALDAEEVVGLTNVFSELIESFEKLQVSCALIGGDIDAVLLNNQRLNSTVVKPKNRRTINGETESGEAWGVVQLQLKLSSVQ